MAEWLCRVLFRSSDPVERQPPLMMRGVVEEVRCRWESEFKGGTRVRSISDEFWRSIASQAQVALLSPFCVSLAAGELELKSFKRFVAQEQKVLEFISRAVEAATALVEDHEARSSLFQFSAELEKLRHAHSSFPKEWKVKGESRLCSKTENYRCFLEHLETASGDRDSLSDTETKKIPIYLAAALAGPLRLCAFMAEQLVNSFCPNNRYQSWIKRFADFPLQAAAQRMDDILDRLNESFPVEEVEFLAKTYERALFQAIEIFTDHGVAQRTVSPLIKLDNYPRMILFYSSNALIHPYVWDGVEHEQNLVKEILKHEQERKVKKFTYGDVVGSLTPLLEKKPLEGRKHIAIGQALLLNTDCEEFLQRLQHVEKVRSVIQVDRMLESPIEKRDWFRKSMLQSKDLSLYIGHSIDDLLCLIEADIGIVYKCSEGLKQMGRKFKIRFLPLLTGLAKKQKQLQVEGNSFSWDSRKDVLYTVNSWTEVKAFIVGRTWGEPLKIK